MAISDFRSLVLSAEKTVTQTRVQGDPADREKIMRATNWSIANLAVCTALVLAGVICAAFVQSDSNGTETIDREPAPATIRQVDSTDSEIVVRTVGTRANQLIGQSASHEEPMVIQDSQVRTVGFQDRWPSPEAEPVPANPRQDHMMVEGGPVRFLQGMDQSIRDRIGREPTWEDSGCVPWEEFGYGEYVGPFRTPHVPDYRIRVNDQLQFIYFLTRERMPEAYRLYVGDVIQITSAIDPTLDQQNIQIISDGKISLRLIGQVSAAGKTVEELQADLNKRYSEYVKNPSVVVQVTQSDTPLADLLNAVDARFGQGGQTQQVQVSPDGTLQLPLIGAVPAVGMSLEEIRREVNARYHSRLKGVEVTPRLVQRAPRFIYVVGQVANPGRYELTGPTSAIQSIALAGGFLQGGNLRNIVVLRRDDQWRLMATRLDLAGGLYGRRPYPSDEIWLRDSDIVLVPPKPIQRLSEAVDLYLTRTLYSIIPEQTIFNFDSGSSL